MITSFFDVEKRIQEAVELALEYKPVQRSVVSAAAFTWDKCDCGLLTVAQGRTFYTSNFPQEDSGNVAAIACGPAFRAREIGIQVVRCSPKPQGTSTAPTVAALEAAAELLDRDTKAAMDAVMCLLQELEDEDDIIDFEVRPSMSRDTGGCVGVEFAAVVALPR